jgi:SAM-dependent methyltransferase
MHDHAAGITRQPRTPVPITRSIWENTRTFFPLFLAAVQQRKLRSVCVVGASDGKFVLPLARQGVRVVAVEPDRIAVEGGPIVLQGPVESTMPGLRKRLAAEGLDGGVRIVQADLLAMPGSIEEVDAVWASCSWHRGSSHRRPLADYIGVMCRLCRPGGGLFGAEYMMPVEPHHFGVDHYLAEGSVRAFLPGWRIDWETYTSAFIQAPQTEQAAAEHVHRMGLIIATRP